MKQDEKQIMDELKREYESIRCRPRRARIMQESTRQKRTETR